MENYGWVTAPQMLDGLGLAETTPGPLIMVLQFVGFVGEMHPEAAMAWNFLPEAPPVTMNTLPLISMLRS